LGDGSVLEEAATGLAAEPTGLHVLAQKRTRCVLGITQAAMQHLHDRDARVETYQIGEREWTYRMCESEFCDRVDCLRFGDAVHECVRSLVDERHQDSVRDESRKVARLCRLLAAVPR